VAQKEQGIIIFSMEKKKKNHQLGIAFFVHHRTVPVVKIVEFVTDRVPYMILRGRWCSIVVLIVHAPGEKKSDDSKDSFYEELDQVF
jgi:hypothetical protein